MVEIDRAGIKDHGVVTGLLLSLAVNEGWEHEIDHDKWDRVIAELLNSDGWLFLVAYEGEEPVGLAAVNFLLTLYGSLEEARLVALIVDEGYRRRRIGSRLVEEALAAARRRDCREIQASVPPDDEDLVGFLKRFGFTSEKKILARPFEG